MESKIDRMERLKKYKELNFNAKRIIDICITYIELHQNQNGEIIGNVADYLKKSTFFSYLNYSFGYGLEEKDTTFIHKVINRYFNFDTSLLQTTYVCVEEEDLEELLVFIESFGYTRVGQVDKYDKDKYDIVVGIGADRDAVIMLLSTTEVNSAAEGKYIGPYAKWYKEGQVAQRMIYNTLEFKRVHRLYSRDENDWFIYANDPIEKKLIKSGLTHEGAVKIYNDLFGDEGCLELGRLSRMTDEMTAKELNLL